MNNSKYNNFMEKLDTNEMFKKQLIDKIKEEDSKKETIKMKIKKKITAIISAISIFSVSGVVFAVTMPEEWRNSIKEFFGIISNEYYEESKIETNETKYSNGYSLTLENYGIDAETLLLSYNLKTAKEITLEYPFVEESDYYYEDNIKIIDKTNKTVLFNSNPDNYLEEPKHTILINKISNTEYKIYEIYQLDSKKITDNTELSIEFNLMELDLDAQGLDYKDLAGFKFEIPLEKTKINYNYKEYDIKNKELVLNVKNKLSSGEVINEKVSLKITKLKNTDFTTKLSLSLSGDYHTDTDYTISITDENNNIILDKDIQYLLRRN